MYKITVRYSRAGLVAYDLKGDTLEIAKVKAKQFKSQGFYVEITDPLGEIIPF